MGVCVCPKFSNKQYDQMVQTFIHSKDWDLLQLQRMYNSGNSIQDIVQVVPFRNNECTRSSHCCGECTRRCHSRCMQDCLNRLYMWRTMVVTTPADRYEQIPLAIRMIVKQEFETLYDLSWCVGDIISRSYNSVLGNYMREQMMYPSENPYKLDYAPMAELDETTGKQKVDPKTGLLHYLEWPKSGLCPFCLPKTTINRRYVNRERRTNASHTD